MRWLRTILFFDVPALASPECAPMPVLTARGGVTKHAWPRDAPAPRSTAVMDATVNALDDAGYDAFALRLRDERKKWLEQ